MNWKKASLFLFTCLVFFRAVSAETLPDPCFHFDFKGMKTVEADHVPDLSGKADLHSKLGLFVVEEDALRIADSAVFFIPASKLPPLTGSFTLSAWLKTGSRGRIQPVFVKGYDKNDLFRFYIQHLYPFGQYRQGGQVRGVFPLGSGYETRYVLESMNHVKQPVREFMPGKWTLMAWIFDRGTLSVYQNGEKIITCPVQEGLQLAENGEPLFIGCVRDSENAGRNKINGDMRINQIRLWDSALSEEQMSALYKAEESRYAALSSHNSFDPGTAWRCYAYTAKLIPGYDPAYEVTLPSTQEYLKNRQVKPFEGRSESRLVSKDGTVRLMIDGRAHYPLLGAVSVGQFRCNIYDPANKLEKVIEDVAAQNFDLIGLLTSSWYDNSLVWKGYRNYDFSAFDAMMRKALAAAPDARIQFAIHPEPIGWFQKQHRDQLEVSLGQWSSRGARTPGYTGNMGSDIWIDVTDDLLYELVRHIESQDYGKHVYDYKLFMSGGGEWHWPMCFCGSAGGYSDATRDTFRAWLREKYGTDEALKKAWNDPAVTLATAVVPTPEQRKTTEFFIFRDPAKSRSSLDFQRYMTDRTVLEIKRNTEAIKLASHYKKTVTLYYGYGFYFMGDITRIQSGHNALRRVLELDSVDHLATPICYRTRGLGLPGMNIGPFAGSIRAHNKLLWQENDLRTSLNPNPQGFGEAQTPKQDIQQLRRGFAQTVTSGSGFWYFPGYQFHSEDFVREFRHLKALGDEILKHDRSSTAEAALIYDEESPFDTAAYASQFLRGHSRDFLFESFYAGAPMDCWLLSDLDKMPDYKVYFFVNSYRTTPELRRRIKAKLARNHAVAVWCYAPGILDENGNFDMAAMKDLTGIDFMLRMVKMQSSLSIRENKKDHPLLARGVNPKSYLFGPLVTVRDPGVEVLARADVFPALGVKKNPDFTSIWSLLPLDRNMIASIYDQAGVHRYLRDTTDVFNGNANYLMVHAARDGEKEIVLRQPSDVTELFSGREIGRGLLKFTDHLAFGDTRLYQVKPGENH